MGQPDEVLSVHRRRRRATPPPTTPSTCSSPTPSTSCATRSAASLCRRKYIALLNPNTRTCPTFRSRSDAELAKAIYRRVPVLIREARDGQPEDNPWGIRFNRMFDMSNDSHLFRTREQLEGERVAVGGERIPQGRDGVLAAVRGEDDPLLRPPMGELPKGKDGRDVAVDVAREDKQDPGFAVLPRNWVEAREVHLRVAKLPKGLLTALRDRDARIGLPSRSVISCTWSGYTGVPDGSADRAASPRSFQAGLTSWRTIPSRWNSLRRRWVCAETAPRVWRHSVRAIFLPSRSTRSNRWPTSQHCLVRGRSVGVEEILRLISRHATELLDSVPSAAKQTMRRWLFAEELLSRVSPSMADGLEGHRQEHG